MTNPLDPEQLLARVRAARKPATSKPEAEPAETIEHQLFGTSFRGDYDQAAEILAGGTIDADGDTSTEEAREAQLEAARDAAAQSEADYEQIRNLISPPSAGNPLDPFDVNRHILREAGLIGQSSDTNQH